MSDPTQAKETLAADLRSVMDDVDALTKATANKAEAEASALRTRIRDKLETAKERVADAQHEAMLRARHAAGATDDYVHDHPWQSIGVAAAFGFVIGALLSRR